MEEAARAPVVGLRVERRRLAAGEVTPRQHRGQRPVLLVDRDERVPEAGDREGIPVADLREHGAARVDKAIGVEVVVGEVRRARLRGCRRRRRRRRAPMRSRRRGRRCASGRDLLRAERQLDAKRRPCAGRRPHRDRAAVRLGDRARDDEAEPRAGNRLLGRGRRPEEALEEPRLLRLRECRCRCPPPRSPRCRRRRTSAPSTVPPSGVNLSAFEIRLPTSCERRSRSP